MNSVNEILEYLKSIGNETYKANVTKLGIPQSDSLGVSIQELRKLTKKIGPSNDLAAQLWNTGIHEAKLLGVLVTDSHTVDPIWAISLMNDVHSWDLCDHLCKNLLFFLPEYEDLIVRWQHTNELYFKRASYVLMATAILHDKTISDTRIDTYLDIIEHHHPDARVHVKKAVSWALREIGKKDIHALGKAKAVAEKLCGSPDRNKQWVGKDAMKELQKLMPVKERRRLVSSASKMAKATGNTSSNN